MYHKSSMNIIYENHAKNSYHFLLSIQIHFAFIVPYSIHKVLLAGKLKKIGPQSLWE